jgi:uncharacterized protein YjbJ (UPF0337 family)
MADKDRVEGSAKNMGGKLKEGVGNLTGDSKMQAEGKETKPKVKSRTPLAGSRIRPKRFSAARSNMTGGGFAPFIVLFNQVVFAVWVRCTRPQHRGWLDVHQASEIPAHVKLLSEIRDLWHLI